MTKKKKSTATIEDAWDALQDTEYDKAATLAEELLTGKADEPEALTILARSRLGSDHTSQAGKIYEKLLKKKSTPPGVRAEAAIVLDQLPQAAEILKTALNKTPDHSDLLFLAALTDYALGHLADAALALSQAVLNGLDWNDEDPVSLIVQHVLHGPDFLDFEHMYLDSQERVLEDKTNPQNRWFNLNIYVYELYTATTSEKRKKKAQDLIDLLLGPGQLSLADGSEKIRRVFEDFAGSENDARFGLEGLKLLDAGDFDSLARLVLAMQLEHLEEFYSLFDIEQGKVKTMAFNQLISLLPLRMAIAMLMLYTMATREDRLAQLMKENMEPELQKALIVSGFSCYYNQVNIYRNRQNRNDKR
jgi:hypothetical protein